MKSYVLVAVALLASSAAFADASKKPVSKWTCEEFLAVEGDFQPKVIYWASGQTKRKPGVVDVEGTEKIVPVVIEECKKTPTNSFMQSLKNAWSSVEAEAKKIKEKL
jgi:acid stress chaperone HdeA